MQQIMMVICVIMMSWGLTGRALPVCSPKPVYPPSLSLTEWLTQSNSRLARTEKTIMIIINK